MQKEDNETNFNKIKDEVGRQLPSIIERVLGKVTEWNAKQVTEWTENLEQAVLEKLLDFSNNFKFIVNVNILEKKGAGFHTSNATFWDGETDGAVSFRWENKALVCVVSAFGVGV
mmetsp:Transcript_15340/g.30178  ORF Transcript_15340/g.30178 Transcript_15340/m.30178 type:complete len:115 (+) Transcript_15340:120-464(+)